MSKTVILLNPMGTDVTPYVNHTSGYAQLLNGTVAAPGDTVYTLPYTNQPGVANISAAVPMLDTKLKATSGEVLVFGYSEGCQIADWWLADQGSTPATGVSPSLVSFLMIGNADRKYGGFAYNRSIFNSVGYTAGKPDATPYTCVDLARQYDPIADFPTATPIVNALVGLSYVGSDQNVYAGALQSVATVMASTPYSQAVSNAACGLLWIHTGLGVAGTGYMSVTVSDPQNLSLADGNITWVWSPTYPVPLLGTGGTFPQSDLQLRTQIEQAYTRPVTIPMPNYGANTGWGVEPFPLPVSPPPVTGWWAELHVSVAITVTPAISVSHGFIGGAVAIVVTPAVSGSSKTLVLASVIQMVTVTASASVILSRGATVTATPSVIPVAALLSSMASSVTVTPSVTVSAEITTTASVSVTVTPSVSVTATVIKPAAVTETVTPAVSTSAVVTEFANVAITATPAVTVAGSSIANIASAVTVTPSVAAASSTAVAAAITVTPSVSTATSDDSSINVTVTPTVSVAAAVIELANVAITATPAVAPVGGNLYTGSATVTATPTVSDGNATAIILPVTVAITATPSVTVAASVTTGLAYDNSTISAHQSLLASGTAFTWSHTAASGSYAIVAVYSDSAGTPTSTAATALVKFGASTMTSLGSISLNNVSGDGFIWVFGLASAPSGAQTVSVKFTQSGHTFSGWAAAYTYIGVSSVGTLATQASTSTSPSVSVSSGTGDLVWGAIANYSGVVSASAAISSFSLTQRQAVNSGTSYPFFISGDTAGATTVTVSATDASGYPEAAVGLNIL